MSSYSIVEISCKDRERRNALLLSMLVLTMELRSRPIDWPLMLTITTLIRSFPFLCLTLNLTKADASIAPDTVDTTESSSIGVRGTVAPLRVRLEGILTSTCSMLANGSAVGDDVAVLALVGEDVAGARVVGAFVGHPVEGDCVGARLYMFHMQGR